VRCSVSRFYYVLASRFEISFRNSLGVCLHATSWTWIKVTSMFKLMKLINTCYFAEGRKWINNTTENMSDQTGKSSVPILGEIRILGVLPLLSGLMVFDHLKWMIYSGDRAVRPPHQQCNWNSNRVIDCHCRGGEHTVRDGIVRTNWLPCCPSSYTKCLKSLTHSMWSYQWVVAALCVMLLMNQWIEYLMFA